VKTNRRKFTILLADSDPDEYYLLRDALAENGYEGKLAYVSDVEELLAYLRVNLNRVSIILMDLHLDGGGGGKALTELRRDPQLMHIPVVTMNLAPEPQDLVRIYALGARSHIEKPLTFGEQVHVIGSFLYYWMDVVALPEHGPYLDEVQAPLISRTPKAMEPGFAV